jgi:uncharacterized protein (TIGR02001 family)
MKPDPLCLTARPNRASQRSSRRRGVCLTWAFLISNVVIVRQAAAEVSIDGDIAVTSDAIYRGLSESFNRPALQADVHATISTGTFAGVFALGTFASGSDQAGEPGATAELTGYLGQHLALGGNWNAQITAYSHHYVGGAQYVPAAYQEIGAQLSYLDLWSVSVTAIPNAPRRPAAADSYVTTRTGRYTAWVAATQAQLQLVSRLFLTAGAGYYFVQGAGDAYSYYEPYPSTNPSPPPSGRGYAYGSVGLAYQWQRWRIDAGYFLAERSAAATLYPYPSANGHVAATLSWQF